MITQACPFLYDVDKDVWLSQCPAVCMYLALKLGYVVGDDAVNCAYTIKVLEDCMDVLCGITRDNGNQMWDADAWTSFTETRLPRWLHIFEETGTRNGLTADRLVTIRPR